MRAVSRKTGVLTLRAAKLFKNHYELAPPVDKNDHTERKRFNVLLEVLHFFKLGVYNKKLKRFDVKRHEPVVEMTEFQDQKTVMHRCLSILINGLLTHGELTAKQIQDLMGEHIRDARRYYDCINACWGLNIINRCRNEKGEEIFSLLSCSKPIKKVFSKRE